MVVPIFFTHVMKTGGTSVLRALRAPFSDDEVFPRPAARPVQMMAKTVSEVLLTMPPDELTTFRMLSAHQPAWVALVVAPSALRITVLRDPIERTVSHLRQLARNSGHPGQLASIYDDDGWRSRLVDHQCQLFAMGPEDAASTPEIDPESLDETAREELTRAMRRFWGTGVALPLAIDTSRCASAITRLEDYDVVGVTEDLPRFVQEVGRRSGLDLPPVLHANTTTGGPTAPPDLLERIADDTRFDRILYERACELAGLEP